MIGLLLAARRMAAPALLAMPGLACAADGLPSGNDAAFGKWQAVAIDGPVIRTGKMIEAPLVVAPLSGARVSSDYGRRVAPLAGASVMHRGIDLAAAYGAPVRASADGIVQRASWFSSFGNYVAIRHPDGLESSYAHLSRVLVRPGQAVLGGQIIGLIGSTGRATGPHLHFETRIAGASVDPLAVLAGAYAPTIAWRPLPPAVAPRSTWVQDAGLPAIIIGAPAP